VAAFVGGLAAIEFPLYQQYTVRARVAEGLLLARDIQMTIVENAANRLPLNSNTPGVGQPPFTPTRFVKDVTVAANGEITISYQPEAGNGTLVLSPVVGMAALTGDTVFAGQVLWNCNSARSSKPGAKGSLPAKYAPPICRT
jgi:type IV pilus assembly protein PilA